MPILRDFILPKSASSLDLSSISPFFISFHASPDPNTGKPWCPDVVAALPYLTEAFASADAPQVAFVDVGQRPEYAPIASIITRYTDWRIRWKELSNVYRTKWNVHNVPTLVRFERIDTAVKEVGRLVEVEILDRKKLRSLVTGSGSENAKI